MEFDIEAMSSKWSYLLARPIIADADNWDFTRFYHVDYSSYTSPIPRAHTVDLVHDYEGLGQGARHADVMRVRLKEVHSWFISYITGVELGDWEFILCC